MTGQPNLPPDKIQPEQNQFLLRYLAAVREYHKYIDFLDTGVDERSRTLATPTSNRLFVLPKFSEQYIDPQLPEDKWPELKELKDLLEHHKRLFILGDPGTGKTTLVGRISVVFADPGNTSFRQQFGNLVPFPFTLRDLDFSRLDSWEDLLRAFFKQQKFQGLEPDYEVVKELFAKGQAFVLLDGLDEVNDPRLRRKLSLAILDGMRKGPESFWWFTSRIVGFNQRQFWGLKFPSEGSDKGKFFIKKNKAFLPNFLSEKEEVYESLAAMKNERLLKELEKEKEFPEVYLAPFDNAQIQRFMRLWFDYFEPKAAHREEALQRFWDSLQAHPGIRHLARIPILLTMMALYYRINQHFPDGRVELYRSITEAYLDKINRRRGLRKGHRLSFAEQTKCLSALAYKMQEKRAEEKDKSGVELTLSREEAEAIFLEKLKEVSRGTSEEEHREKVKEFFDSLEVRSEILIPKAEGEYGFLHLSYQEFFAAEALKDRFQVCTGRRARPEEEEAFWKELKGNAKQPSWHETIVLFFETFKMKWEDHPEDCLYAFERLFDWKEKDGRVAEGLELPAAKVLADEFVGMNFAREARFETLDNLFLASYEASWQYEGLLDYLKSWGALTGRYLQPTAESEIQDTDYRWVEVGAGFSDLEILQKFSNCIFLNLSEAKISDLSALRALKSLKYLNLTQTQVSDLGPLGALKSLRYLDLTQVQVSDVDPLGVLKSLRYLYLNQTQVSDVSPLGSLKSLMSLDLTQAPVSDVSPLGSLKSLRYLSLAQTPVSDVDPLEGLESLQGLSLTQTQVSDVSPLEGLKSLVVLDLTQTQVSDVSPLREMKSLTYLFLNQTPVSDLSFLYHLKNLYRLFIDKENFSPDQLAALQEALPSLTIIDPKEENTAGGDDSR